MNWTFEEWRQSPCHPDFVYKLQFSADGFWLSGQKREGDDEEAEEKQEMA